MGKLALALGALAAATAQARSGELQYVPIYASRGPEKIDFPLRIDGHAQAGRIAASISPHEHAFSTGRHLGEWRHPAGKVPLEKKMREDEARLIREQGICNEPAATGHYILEASALRLDLDDYTPRRTNAVLVQLVASDGNIARYWYTYFCDALREGPP